MELVDGFPEATGRLATVLGFLTPANPQERLTLARFLAFPQCRIDGANDPGGLARAMSEGHE